MVESDIITISYFFLIYPVKYTDSNSESTLFHLEDNAYSCGCIVFAATSTARDLQAANFVTLTFKTHKDGVRGGGGIRHKVFGDPLLCPKADLFRWVLHLRTHGVPPCNPLAHIMTPAGRWENITPTIISKTLKNAVGFYVPNLGFKAKDISYRSLCTSGDMTLLCLGLDSDIIKLIEHWCVDEVLRYLHVQT